MGETANGRMGGRLRGALPRLRGRSVGNLIGLLRARARPRARNADAANVPEGLNDNSLAVYCLGTEKTSSRPVRERYDWVGRNVLRP
jgi:hypothetical protein